MMAAAAPALSRRPTARSGDGGSLRQVTSGRERNYRPSWSHDGKWIYHTKQLGNDPPWIWKIRPDGSSPERITSGREAFESPDGRFLFCYEPSLSGDGTLRRLPLSGGSPESVLAFPGRLEGRWAVLGDDLYVFDSVMSPPAIVRYRIGKPEPHTIVTLPGNTRLYPGPAFTISPDGRYAIYNALDPVESDLMLVDKFN